MQRIIFVSLAALAMTAAVPATVSAQGAARVGTLTCEMSGGVGMIVASQKELICAFSPSSRGWRAERYVGVINRFGIDIGATTGGRMVWNVYAPTAGGRHALAGDYGGASAEATVGAGVGANALVGGSNRTVTLQPLSLQGQSGASLAAGVAGLALRPAR